jgi:P27 family predicted phage terminase small subunit
MRKTIAPIQMKSFRKEKMQKSKSVPKPPKHLRAATSQWFTEIVGEFLLESHHVRLLIKACEANDRCEQAREALKKYGLTFENRFGQPCARPEVAIERDSRIAFARLLRELGLDIAPPSDSRPNALPANRR